MVQEIDLDINKTFAKNLKLVQLRVSEVGEQIKINLKDKGVPVPYDLQKSVRFVGRYPNNTAYYGEPMRMASDSSVTLTVDQRITMMHGNWKSAYIEIYDALPVDGTLSKTFDFKNKISGSTVSNTTVAQYLGSTGGVDAPPTGQFVEFTQTHYNNIAIENDGLTMDATKGGVNQASQIMVISDVVAELEKMVPDKFRFATTIGQKVLVADSLLEKIKFTIRSMAYTSNSTTGAVIARTGVQAFWEPRLSIPDWNKVLVTTKPVQDDYTIEIDALAVKPISQASGKIYFSWRAGTASDTVLSRLFNDYASWSIDLRADQFQSITTQDFMLAVEEAGNSVENVQNWYYNLGKLNEQLENIMADGALGSYTAMQTTVNRLLSYRNHQRDIQTGYTPYGATISNNGVRSLTITYTVPSPSTPYVFLQSMNTLISGKEYVFRCRMILTNSPEAIRTVSVGLRNGGFPDRSIILNKTAYVDVVIPFTYSKTASNPQLIFVGNQGGTNYTYVLGDVSITEGSLPPDDWNASFLDQLTLKDLAPYALTANVVPKPTPRVWTAIPLLSGFSGNPQYRVVFANDGRAKIELRGRILSTAPFLAQTQVQVSNFTAQVPIQNHIVPITAYTSVPISLGTLIIQTNGAIYIVPQAETTQFSIDGVEYYTSN